MANNQSKSTHRLPGRDTVDTFDTLGKLRSCATPRAVELVAPLNSDSTVYCSIPLYVRNSAPTQSRGILSF